jgi:putative heme-binding domain-containing protein
MFSIPARRHRLVAASLLGLWLVLTTGSQAAVESWADPRLAVTRNLAVWIDVSRQNTARGDRQLAPLNNIAESVDYLFDASGRKRDFIQPFLGHRPRFTQDFNGAFLSFDGVDDFMSTPPGRETAPAVTVLMVVRIRTNSGPFRALLAANHAGRNDYTSGMNLDLGSIATPGVTRVNAEGTGFSGEGNLCTSPLPFRQWAVVALVCGTGPGGVRLYIDGRAQGARDRTPAALDLDELTLGARHYSNDANRPYAQDFLEGDVAEALVYTEPLPEADRTSVEGYLLSKYAGLRAAQIKTGMAAVDKPPPVQVLAPGFTARALPVDLNNINVVKYLPSGGLVAAGYDGSVWHLTDTDGDGVEDHADLFWRSDSIKNIIGMTVTPAGYPRGEGVFVTSRGRVSLLVDTNADHRADREIVVAEGWKAPRFVSGGVIDALGIALDPKGNVYFALGNNFFWEAYEVNKETGKSEYDLHGERGTIQRVSADFSRRETVCTGVRFAVGLAFNREGDLFATDQEGATWLPNGNPLDELLQILPGRHYGFPPRHPRHLPGVVDEPSVFDYAPQHQSTCGLNFNDPVNGGPTFGPADWAGEALVSGYSRGKVWRTRVVKTPEGYVARNQLLAVLQSLVVDACVSPRGDLIVSTHSGQPDWGSGPGGAGKLWRIHHSDRTIPQPLFTWSPSPTEVRIAFDRPLEPSALRDLSKRSLVVQGRHAQPGDRFETLRPGYQVVHDQMAQPRAALDILSAGLSPDRRTLTLTTAAREADLQYPVLVPVPAATKTNTGPELQGFPDLELGGDLHGLKADWRSRDGTRTWSGWLPHASLAVSRELTRGSPEHDALWELVGKPGTLSLEGRLRLVDMLQPAVQPGATLDYTRPVEQVTVRFVAPAGSSLRSPGARLTSDASPAGTEFTLATAASPTNFPLLHLEVPTGGAGSPAVSATWSTADEARPRAFPLHRFLMPWVHAGDADPAAGRTGVREVPELAGGNWLHGRRLFFSERVGCSRCHVIRGEGGHVGPDLSNLVHRDYGSVVKDIRFPNATLNPDHVANTVELADGESLTGILVAESTTEVRVTDATGRTTPIPRSRIRHITPSGLSLMPEGLWEGMSAGEQRDLLTFLLVQPLEPAGRLPVQGQPPPPSRRLSEIRRVLDAVPGPASAPRGDAAPLRIVLCAAPKDPGHPLAGMHDYPLWRERWSRLLALADNVAVETADLWPSAEQFHTANLIVFYHNNPAWSASKAPDLDRFLERGGGVVFLHWSMNGQQDVEALARRIAKAWRNGFSRFRFGPLPIQFARHEITAGLESLQWVDESYWNLPGDLSGATVLASTPEEGQPQPQAWIREQGAGRVFVCITGHFTWTFDDPLYRILLLRGLAWSSHQPLDRFSELVTVGVELSQQP